MLTLILGGARSGKSRLAQTLASECASVSYVATAVFAGDDDLAARIARHRADRPPHWTTIEAPLEVAESVARAESSDAVIVDCLTIWLSNFMWEHRELASRELEPRIDREIARIAEASKGRRVLVVSNEVGSATVPEAAVARLFRDLHGLMNQWAAERAEEVILTVAGLPLHLKKPL
jgi:adenosylcobinamide kinase/adenosylcobinamide-phosphate guanylyltransferase